MGKTESAETLALDKTQQKKVTKKTRQIKKAIEDGLIQINTRKDNKLKAEQKRGLIYIGHIPHGFYEDEIRKYFKQFGKVTNVKVCRSRTTGNSKGFGYVEFTHPEVAQIAADAMNNYVMFKRRIVTEYIPYDKRPKGLFHGKSSTTQNTSTTSRRGKQKFSRNKILDEKVVAKKQKSTLKKLSAKIEKLKNLGIQCNIQPVGVDKTPVKEVELKQRKSSHSVDGFDSAELSDEFKKPTLKQSKMKTPSSSRSKDLSDKSSSSIRSKRTFLTKSLDSVKTLLSSKTLAELQDEETQTVSMKRLKTEKKDNKKNKLKQGKIKKEKKLVVLNQQDVKKIARELIRKRGNPLINLVSPAAKTRKSAKIK